MRSYLCRLGMLVVFLVVLPVSSGVLPLGIAILLCITAVLISLVGTRLEKGTLAWVDYVVLGVVAVCSAYCFYVELNPWIVLILGVTGGLYSRLVYRDPHRESLK